MFHLIGEENELLMCPYDKSHSIRLARMQVHLIKCRKNHLNNEKAQCPFNVTHLVNKVELEVHIKICPQRMGFETFRLKDETINDTLSAYDKSLATSVESVNTSKKEPLNECKDSWDVEPDVPSYNPELYTSSANIFRQPRGLNPSERRAFRAKERERLLGMNTE